MKVERDVMDSIQLQIVRDTLALSVEARLNQGTTGVVRPGIDDLDVPFLAFNTMEDYRRWCDTLPKWLGYHRAEEDI